MKNILKRKLLSKTLLFFGAIAVIYGCELELMKDYDFVEHDSDRVLDMSIGDFLISQDTSVSYFARAMEHAGMMDIVNGENDHTVIVPNDIAIDNFIRSLGYNAIELVPPAIMSNFLGMNIFEGRVLSYDLEIGETLKYPTLSGDSIYLTRTSRDKVDEYILTVNATDSLNSPSGRVIQQNLQFSNGVVHIVNNFTRYSRRSALPDESDFEDEALLDRDTIDVIADVYMRGGQYSNRAYNENTLVVKQASPAFTRKTLLRFPVKELDFDKIGSARLYVHVLSSDRIFNDYDLSVYEVEDEDWFEESVTWDNAPTIFSIPVAQVIIPDGPESAQTWYNMDITSLVNEAYSNDDVNINMGLWHSFNGNVNLHSREYQKIDLPDGTFENGPFAPYLLVTSPPPTILSLAVNTNINVELAEGAKEITLEELRLEGTSNKNISFTVKEIPESGYFVKYGIPLEENSVFNQADIANGGIKYIPIDEGNYQVVLEARDYRGGYLEELVVVPFVVQ